jgi:hypothetical protein
MTHQKTIFLTLFCLMTGCVESIQDDTQDEDVPCVTDEDCLIEISNWAPICEGGVLLTPTGTGENTCVDNLCETDFVIEETDCAALGLTCGTGAEQTQACIL